jgi:hypothetical protein
MVTEKFSGRRYGGKCTVCLFAMLVAFLPGMVIPAQGPYVYNAHGYPCYGLASESADAAACLRSEKNERNSSPVLLRTSMNDYSRGTAAALTATSLSFHSITGCMIAPILPGITAHHLRI